MAMPGGTDRREVRVGIVAVALVLLVVVGCAVAVLWIRPVVSAAGTRTPESVSRILDISDEWRSVPGVRDVLAVDESRRVPGEDFGEADREEHSVSVEVSLEDDLTGPRRPRRARRCSGWFVPRSPDVRRRRGLTGPASRSRWALPGSPWASVV
ncbi:hypothetical protein ACWZJV_15915 [Nocardioides sp. WG-D5]